MTKSATVDVNALIEQIASRFDCTPDQVRAQCADDATASIAAMKREFSGWLLRERVEYQRQQAAASQRRANEKLRQQVLAAYGASCACCGEDEPLFLEVDHVGHAVSGKQHRLQLGNGHIGGTTFYRHLRKAGFPNTYRLMCSNCNHGRFRNGGECPHRNAATVKS